MKDRLTLLDAIHLPLNRPEYVPRDGVTHCNSYVNEVCELMGYKLLGGRLANEIVDALIGDGSWSVVAMEKCQDLANEGTLVVAGIRGSPHGHVNIICPGKEKTSGRWGQVPSCANVGSEIFIGKGINWAYSSMPQFFAWRPTL